MESASYFREKARQCRRLAACILTRGDPTAASLNALALEFDEAAAVIDAGPAHATGCAEDITPQGAVAGNRRDPKDSD